MERPWYVFGYCLDREAYRLFKLNRLWDLRTEEETFCEREIPEEELSFGDAYLAEGSIHLKAIFAESEKYRLIEELFYPTKYSLPVSSCPPAVPPVPAQRPCLQS